MNHNRFLMQFMKSHQQAMSAKPNEPVIPKAKADKSEKTPKSQVSYKSIIEEKPPKADVVEYFRKRIEELSEDD